MSTASPAGSNYTHTSSHRPPPYQPAPADLPHRTQSTSVRNPPSAGIPRRSNSHSYAYGRQGTIQSQQTPLINVARRDQAVSNVAQAPSSSPHTASHEGTVPMAANPTRVDSLRNGAHAASRAAHGRYASEGATPVAGNGSPAGPATPRTVAEAPERSIPMNAAPQPRRRTTISAQTGQWALGKTIGAGSMGKVKLARNMETGEQVAIKIVPRQSTEDHHSTRDRERADHSKEIRTAREAAIVTLLHHPYICGMRDVVRTNYHWYMLFEFVNGGQMLDYIISHGRLKEKQARKFGRQIASALDYCHRNSIVHRDLKIENILISKTGDIKIIDFGLSNLFSPRNHLKTFCGSLYFAAPELLQARQYVGPEVDVWSFGIVLYVLVCGKVPFDDQSMPQLHAKIKRGVVDYPAWLSTECRNLISRMLVTDPRQRASLSEIMNHPWMTKGFNGPPENYLPHREPLQLPLDPQIIEKMTGFDFGSPEYITTQLTKVIESEDYQNAVRLLTREQAAHTSSSDRKRGVFDFYRRRNSITSKDTLVNSSAEAIQLGSDPVNAFSPLISIYYLVREKQERERLETNPGALSMPRSPGEKPLKMPDLPAPAAAHTNEAAYEMPGEKATGGRARPRARTHGEDEVTEGLKKIDLNPPPHPTPPSLNLPQSEQPHVKKESAAAGLLRKFSTRRHRDPDRERPNAPPPAVAVQTPDELAPPRKSFSVRKPRDRETPPLPTIGSSQSQHPDLLAPPGPPETVARLGKGLGRSTSVSSADFRRRGSRRTGRESPLSSSLHEAIPPSGSNQSSLVNQPVSSNEGAVHDNRPRFNARAAATTRTKSLGHARRESIQARRARREEAREANVPEETSQELEEEQESGTADNVEGLKPVYLKGLFSVSTTSTKPLSFIRSDIIRVLNQLNVQFTEIKGGFSCRHAPSIELSRSPDNGGELQTTGTNQSHKRKISFGGRFGGDRDPPQESPEHLKKTISRRSGPDTSFTNSEESSDSIPRVSTGPTVPGETTTQVQSDLGGNMVLKFEIFIVKVPLFSLHGVQFKKVAGGTWQYKNMAQKILNELRL
ncbi:Pkinase-domain-containing protein [Xylona heveae TC161]|uniref:non-specific serine/threonine protein kinase n=1 Tax=Xylona heveae (strain CBS 132557 / TC161) TaxID=1328760 RepID=A0A165JKZ7_XYLHT|nr:Pkinase-domain-containing protein [Xylona heveae TC161]KZF26367.1 Pkinase-domain-containing protein [Xylona heveae TC161]